MINVGHKDVLPALKHQITELEIAMDYAANHISISKVPELTHLNAEAKRDHRIEEDFMRVSKYVNLLQLAKNVYYDNSWSKRGLLSMFFNMERKWERIASQITSTAYMEELREENGETFVDTCVDLAAYAMKLCAWVFVRRPDLYKRFLVSVTAELEKAKMMAPREVSEPSCDHGITEICDHCRPHGVHHTV